ncbi:mitochondrial 37S ribosomal protein mS42 [Phyllosticta citribraziliensis]|uniref:Manganese/iron superoxide dismutase n=1 Tax=Phyllosticta citribraziliensis TaxID=989973 RepID=A0ABR1LC66_9PEZI
MILARLARQQPPLRAAARCSQRISHVSQRRHIVEVAKLTNVHNQFVANGIGEDGIFMSAKGFQTAYTENMQHMAGRLNKLITGKAQFDNKDAQAITVLAARNPADAAVFNFASAMFNNHFFFSKLSPTAKVEIPEELTKTITASFGSVDGLRREMLATAFHMFGPGYVWLVWHRPSNGRPPEWKILATYLAGSPLSDAHWRRQSVNMTTENIDTAADVQAAGQEAKANQVPGGQQHATPQNEVGAMGKYSSEGKKQATRAPGGADVTPVLCVSTWEHAWLPTHGITGKAKYLAQWWDHVNWATVFETAPKIVTGKADTWFQTTSQQNQQQQRRF